MKVEMMDNECIPASLNCRQSLAFKVGLYLWTSHYINIYRLGRQNDQKMFKPLIKQAFEKDIYGNTVEKFRGQVEEKLL